MNGESDLKEAYFIGSCRDDLRDFPKPVRRAMAYAILVAQAGKKHPDAKPLTGDPAFAGADVVEVVDDYDRDTYRAVYTVRFAERVYVLHAFQKKSRQGIKTPKHDIDVIKSRLRVARELHEKWVEGEGK